MARAWRSKTVSELLKVKVTPPIAEEQERHRIHCRLVLALLDAYWNPYKYGLDGEYPWAKGAEARKSSYLGHNIAAIAVNPAGSVIDFDFNHNELFNSSIEHAEARLLRRLFALGHRFGGDEDRAFISRAIDSHNRKEELDRSDFAGRMMGYMQLLNELYDENNAGARTSFSRALNRITIYTSLESCAQCSGMMALGGVERVVYLQADPGQNGIGAIMYNLNDKDTAFSAPIPVPASAYGIEEFAALSSAYGRYLRKIKSTRVKLFHRQDNTRRPPNASITTFLCTAEAKKILSDAARNFYAPRLRYGNWRPVPDALTNRDVLKDAQIFLRGVILYGRRGTSHGS